MNTAPRLLFPASLESDHLRNCTSGTQPPAQTTQSSFIYLPDAENLFEGVTLCQACNNAGYIRLDEHHAEQCVFCQ